MPRIFFLLFLFPVFAQAQIGIINTLAGTGTPGWSGDGGPAILAQLYQPRAVIVDGTGNIFIAEGANNRVRMINTSGIITEIAGNGTPGWTGDGGVATAAEINNPAGLALDGAGNLYISDNGNYIVRKVSPAIHGIITTVAGTGAIGFSGDGGPATAASFHTPFGISFDSHWNLYISDLYNSVIRKITAHTDTIANTDTISTFAGQGTVSGSTGDGGLATACYLYYPDEVNVDSHDNVYVSDVSNHKIRKINTSNIITTVAGTGISGFTGDGGPATSAELYFPGGLKIDALDNFYFETYDNHIRKVNSSGIISTIAGTGVAGYTSDGIPATASEINQACDVAIDHHGNILIADQFNHRIRIVGNNTPPSFVSGHQQLLSICENAATDSINALLAINDADAGQPETWHLLSAPSHGTALTAYTAISTGGPITPHGLSYTPAPGYVGNDTFRVSIYDGFDTFSTAIYVTVHPSPTPGTISGTDSVCVGLTTALADTAMGGLWGSSNLSISSVTGSGIVFGAAPGTDTMSYTITGTDFGCSATAILRFQVLPYAACDAGVNALTNENYGIITIAPNPAHNAITITAPGAINKVSIINLWGQTVISSSTSQGTAQASIAISDLPSGIYYVRINGTDVRKFVKE